MLVIGITGNSGSGKSLACRKLEALGAKNLNADEIYNGLLQPNSPMMQQIICAFGKEFVNEEGTLNRKLMGQLIFNDKDKRELLNRITHPGIVKEIQSRITAMAAHKVRIVAVEAALLFESGMDKFMDEVWVIDATYEDKLKRIVKRDGLSLEEAAQRLLSQADPLALRQNANRYIVNDGSAKDLEQIIENELNRLLKERRITL
ncbi:MAG: dephospho-CoA kinase [Firmicutes bacterium]|nr:dephospho-CoA kinase [Bacillota bacterium]